MVQDRLKELLDFAKTESPYKSANRGWLNQDVYLSLGNSSPGKLTENPDFVRINLFWQPLSRLLSSLFFILLATSIFVFSALSFAKGTFSLHFISDSLSANINVIQVDQVQEKSSFTVEGKVLDEDENDNPEPNSISEGIDAFADSLEVNVVEGSPGNQELVAKLSSQESIENKIVAPPLETQIKSKSNFF